MILETKIGEKRIWRQTDYIRHENDNVLVYSDSDGKSRVLNPKDYVLIRVLADNGHELRVIRDKLPIRGSTMAESEKPQPLQALDPFAL